MTIHTDKDDIPAIVEAEIRQARLANIPLDDQPRYIADRIRLRISGCAGYVRKRSLSPSARAAEIKRRYTGANVPELAKEFNLSFRRIQQIVNSK